MVLSRRERYIGIAAGVILGAAALNWLVIDPLLEQRGTLDKEIATRGWEVHRMQQLLADARQSNREWSRMAATGLKRNQSEAESQLVHSVTDWAQEAGLNLPAQKAERTDKEKEFNKITFRATGAGGMSQISRFLWRIQSATIPVRITDLQITSHKEGTDDLALVLGIGTIYPAPESEKPPAGGAAPPQAPDRRTPQ